MIDPASAVSPAIRPSRTAALTLLLIVFLSTSGTRTMAAVGQSSGPPEAFGQRWTQPQGAVPATILARGRWFNVNQSFSASIVGTQITPYIGSGPYAPQAAPNEIFVLLTLQMHNSAYVALPPPIPALRGLSTQDGLYSCPLDRPLVNRFNDARTAIPSNSNAAILAIYRLPRRIDFASLYYNVFWNQGQEFVLAQLPPPS